jgi:hypothetical protein
MTTLRQPLNHHSMNWLENDLSHWCCPQVSDGGAQYVLRNCSSAGRASLATLDAWGAAPPEGNAQQLAEYEGLVALPFDALGDPGWNLQVGR